VYAALGSLGKIFHAAVGSVFETGHFRRAGHCTRR
jgi:hypothetical protein